jgi:hypothetical protein
VLPNAIDLGSGVFICWDDDGRGFVWYHPTCRAGSTLRFKPDPKSTGHELVNGGRGDEARLMIRGSLLCPGGCGFHGVIENGRWYSC